MMKPVVTGLLTGVTLAAVLAGCNPAEKTSRDHSGAQPSYSAAPDAPRTRDTASADAPDPRTLPVPKVDGKPMWSANRKRSAEENAQAAFERNGEIFGASDVDDFVAKAHAFTSKPPAGVQKIARANGDVELYDARSNTFAVVTKDGAPRTMFKPTDGPAYWAKEKDKAANGGDTERTATRKRTRKSDDNDG